MTLKPRLSDSLEEPLKLQAKAFLEIMKNEKIDNLDLARMRVLSEWVTLRIWQILEEEEFIEKLSKKS